MATLVGDGPWNVQYEIDFKAQGDTVHTGFWKHIQEIERIYGLLNALNEGKATGGDVEALIGKIKHNSLKEIQGGQSEQYYHLTNAQVNKLDNLTKEHNSLDGLQGGGSGERYHLTNAQVTKLNNLPAANDVAKKSDIITQHNSLSGLQGGQSGQYYHLTQALLNKLTSLDVSSLGGVSEVSVGNPGYLQFNGGLIIQWGFTGADSVTLYPKSLSKLYAYFGQWYGGTAFNFSTTGVIGASYTREWSVGEHDYHETLYNTGPWLVIGKV